MPAATTTKPPLPPALQTTLRPLQTELTNVIRFLHRQGWTPATSSNFSHRLPAHLLPNIPACLISVSGKDKEHWTADDFLIVDNTGLPVFDTSHRPSAETILHTMRYQNNPGIQCILHTHSVNGTVLSRHYGKQGIIEFSGYEILKGFSGIHTHDTTVRIPIFPNSQNIAALSKEVEAWLATHPNTPGFLLEGHGLYTWGATIADARRHVEVFEFLFEVLLKCPA